MSCRCVYNCLTSCPSISICSFRYTCVMLLAATRCHYREQRERGSGAPILRRSSMPVGRTSDVSGIPIGRSIDRSATFAPRSLESSHSFKAPSHLQRLKSLPPSAGGCSSTAVTRSTDVRFGIICAGLIMRYPSMFHCWFAALLYAGCQRISSRRNSSAPIIGIPWP